LTYEDAAILDKKHQYYLDEKDYFAQFIFSPSINENSDYAHLDKNLATTRLSSRYNEPERARALLEGLHILSNNKYFIEETQQKLVRKETKNIMRQVCVSCGHTHLSDDGLTLCANCSIKLEEGEFAVIEIPIYQQVKVFICKYPKIYHKLKSAFYSLTTTAAARDGHLIRAATTTHFEKSESMEDRTKKDSKWLIGSNKDKNNSKGWY